MALAQSLCPCPPTCNAQPYTKQNTDRRAEGLSINVIPLGLITKLLLKYSDKLNYVIGGFRKAFVVSFAELRKVTISFIIF